MLNHTSRAFAIAVIALVGQAAFTSLPESMARAASLPATSLEDLCPGTPDPCVVTGSFILPRVVELDLGGRALIMRTGSSLVGSKTHVWPVSHFKRDISIPITITNAASITLEKGAKIAVPSLPLLETFCQEPEGIVVSTYPYVAGGVIDFSPGGTYTFTVNTGALRVLPASAPVLNSWGLEVCSSDTGCNQYMSADVPKTMTLAPDTFGLGTYNGSVTSSLTLPPIANVTRVRIIDVSGALPAIATTPVAPEVAYAQDWYQESSFWLNGVMVANRTAWCGDWNGAFNWSEIRDHGDYGGLTLQSTGNCTFDGKISATRKDGGAFWTGIDINCNGVTIGKKGKIDTRSSNYSGRTLQIDGGTGDITIAAGAKVNTSGGVYDGGLIELRTTGNISIAKGAKFTASGGFDSEGGLIDVQTSGACEIGGKLVSKAKPYDDDDGDVRGGAGQISIECGSVSLLSGAMLVSGTHWAAQDPLLEISATAGDVLIAEKTLLRASGADKFSSGIPKVSVSAAGACAVHGRIVTTALRPIPMTFLCESFSLGTTGSLEALGEEGGSISVDTSGTLTADVPGACSIGGAMIASGKEYGGRIDLDCGTTFSLDPDGELLAMGGGPTSSGNGLIEVLAGGEITIAGVVSADSQGDFDGGAVYIEGCNVTVNEGGAVHTKKGWRGGNHLTAHDTLSVFGEVVSTQDEGTNSLTYRNAVNIGVSSAISPSTAPIQNSALSPCP